MKQIVSWVRRRTQWNYGFTIFVSFLVVFGTSILTTNAGDVTYEKWLGVQFGDDGAGEFYSGGVFTLHDDGTITEEKPLKKVLGPKGDNDRRITDVEGAGQRTLVSTVNTAFEVGSGDLLNQNGNSVLDPGDTTWSRPFGFATYANGTKVAVANFREGLSHLDEFMLNPMTGFYEFSKNIFTSDATHLIREVESFILAGPVTLLLISIDDLTTGTPNNRDATIYTVPASAENTDFDGLTLVQAMGQPVHYMGGVISGMAGDEIFFGATSSLNPMVRFFSHNVTSATTIERTTLNIDTYASGFGAKKVEGWEPNKFDFNPNNDYITIGLQPIAGAPDDIVPYKDLILKKVGNSFVVKGVTPTLALVKHESSLGPQRIRIIPELPSGMIVFFGVFMAGLVFWLKNRVNSTSVLPPAALN